MLLERSRGPAKPRSCPADLDSEPSDAIPGTSRGACRRMAQCESRAARPRREPRPPVPPGRPADRHGGRGALRLPRMSSTQLKDMLGGCGSAASTPAPCPLAHRIMPRTDVAPHSLAQAVRPSSIGSGWVTRCFARGSGTMRMASTSEASAPGRSNSSSVRVSSTVPRSPGRVLVGQNGMRARFL